MHTRWQVGDVEIVRILDLELTLPPSLLAIGDDEATQAATIARAPWAVPRWATSDNQVVFAFAATGIVSGGTRIVVDPALGYDERCGVDEQAAFERALADAGFAPDDVDIVFNTHNEGTGWNATTAGTPLFPRARYLWPTGELARGERPVAFDADELDPPFDLAPGVGVEAAPGHTSGATVVRVRSGGQEAVVAGDLFIHPLQLADIGWCGNDELPAETIAVRTTLLDDAADRGVLLVAPHFPTPGGGHVRRDGEGRWALG